MSGGTLFIVEQGPDLRAFLYSGLAEALAQDGAVSFLAPKAAAGYIPDVYSVFDSAEHLSPQPDTVRRAARLLDIWTERDIRRTGGERWVNFASGVAGRSLRQRVQDLLTSIRVPGGATLLRRRIASAAPNPSFAELLHEIEPTRVVLSNAATPLAIEVLRTARQLGVATVVVQNSWKDAFSRPSIPVSPDVLATETQTALDQFSRFNPRLAATTLVAPSLHAETFRRDEYRMDREDFCAAASLDPARPIACYTAAAPRAISGERALVAELLDAMERDERLRDVQLLIRLNPMEDDPAAWDALVEGRSATIQRPDWDWHADALWSCPTPADSRTWVSTVLHSAVNISIPSTVTKDFLRLGRPVVNPVVDEASERFWDAPFYREYHGHPQVRAAYSGGEIAGALAAVLADAQAPQEFEKPPFAALLSHLRGAHVAR